MENRVKREKQELGVGIIGSGRIGTLRANMASRHPSVRFLAVTDLDPEKAGLLGESVGADFTSSDNYRVISHPEVNTVIMRTLEASVGMRHPTYSSLVSDLTKVVRILEAEEKDSGQSKIRRPNPGIALRQAIPGLGRRVLLWLRMSGLRHVDRLDHVDRLLRAVADRRLAAAADDPAYAQVVTTRESGVA